MVAEYENECFVSGTLATILRVSRFAGIAPFRFEKRENGWSVSFSPRLALFGYLLLIAIGALFVGRLIYEEFLVETDTEVTTIWGGMHRAAWVAEDTMVAVVAGTTLYAAPAHVRSLIQCLNQMQKINFLLNIHHWPTQYSKKLVAFFIFWGLISVSATVGDYVVVIVYASNSETWIKALDCLYYVHYWIAQLCKMQYVMIVLHVCSGFTAINDSLRNLYLELEQNPQTFAKTNLSKAHKPHKKIDNYVNSKPSNSKLTSGSATKSSPHHEIVRRTALAYASACDVVQELSRSRGLTMLTLLGSLFLHLIVTYYYWIINLSVDHRELHMILQVFYVLVFVFWSFVHTFNLVVIIEPCHMTHMEMKTTRVLVSRLMRCTRSVYDPLWVELDKFYKYLLLHEVTYIPLKVTKITRGLLLRIFANVTTYLVVLVQIK